jgi:hypothetical protein
MTGGPSYRCHAQYQYGRLPHRMLGQSSASACVYVAGTFQCQYMYVYVHMYVCVCAYVCMCMCICMYVYVYTCFPPAIAACLRETKKNTSLRSSYLFFASKWSAFLVLFFIPRTKQASMKRMNGQQAKQSTGFKASATTKASK